MNRARTKLITGEDEEVEEVIEQCVAAPLQSWQSIQERLRAPSATDTTDSKSATTNTPVRIDSTICTPRSKSAKFLTNDQLVPFVGQRYEELKELCKKANKLFEDPHFPANETSLFAASSTSKNDKIVWKRPKEIVKNPKFVVDGMTQYDVDQGELGDCWFLASISALVMKSEHCRRVIPDGQSFDDDYFGIFRFRFWFFGQWVEVSIDDRLPTIDGKLAYLRSRREPDEFWPALLEKAYAKLVGNYEALQGGSEDEAMEDLTGGIAYSVHFKDEQRRRLDIPATLFDTLKDAMQDAALVCTAINPIQGRTRETILYNGLVAAHAYSVTGARDVTLGSRKIQLVRIRNPWGDENEWNGDWSDKSSKWKDVDREAFDLKVEPDGEWWMDYRDFITFFDRVTICYLGPDAIPEFRQANANTPSQWKEVLIRDQWIPYVNAGGAVTVRRPPSEKFWTNPQYVIRLTGEDNSDKSIIVGLMQVDRRRLRMLEGTEMLFISPVIFSLTPDGKPDKLLNTKPVEYSQLRQCQIRMRLKPGNYLLVASTADPDEAGHFLMRIFAESSLSAAPTDKSEPIEDVYPAALREAERLGKEAILLYQTCKRADGQSTGEIDCWSLQSILNDKFVKALPFTIDGVSIETCRSLVGLLDTDLTGRLGQTEFVKLWTDLHALRTKFSSYDQSNSGMIPADKLREALESVNIRPGARVLNSVVKRYCRYNGQIGFDDYLLCLTRARSCVEVFKAQKKGNDTTVQFEFDQFLQIFTYV